MATNPELMRVEESVKEKFAELIRNLSHLELKKFQKHEYAEMVFQDMLKLLPNIDKKQLKLTSHYISNALDTERKRELGERSRKGNAPKDRNAALLSSTVREDFKETMPPGDENSTSEDTDQEGLTSSSEPLDDSITALKRTISTENKADDEQIACTPNYQKSAKCCESCKFSQKHKKKVEMIQCCFCMLWYHQLCVGIGKDDPIGIWVCLNCRSVPTSIQNEA